MTNLSPHSTLSFCRKLLYPYLFPLLIQARFYTFPCIFVFYVDLSAPHPQNFLRVWYPNYFALNEPQFNNIDFFFLCSFSMFHTAFLKVGLALAIHNSCYSADATYKTTLLEDWFATKIYIIIAFYEPRENWSRCNSRVILHQPRIYLT